ncbi:putative Eukaryotic translation initiation factor 3 subunit I [Paratrimastix pyriformis]|uniref:Serine-threonine kinase receptor-associated protein n=1 Tax=Paratrimastix pyriformis TaxID=342808 RepID=A0ABQ8UG32_9EUKA|nr:putative Eukaryotic translation initiation factor 3 subunit I [Paratrimastix pyriformis]
MEPGAEQKVAEHAEEQEHDDGGLVPLALMGTERPITQVKFNSDGDILFTASKANHISAWFTDGGRWIGNYLGHRGVIWSFDVNRATTLMVSGSGDSSIIFWDVMTGRVLAQWHYETIVRVVAFSYGDQSLLVIADRQGDVPSMIYVYDVPAMDQIPAERPEARIALIHESDAKITRAVWGFLNEDIVTGLEDGTIFVWNLKNREITHRIPAHSKAISCIAVGKNGTGFLTTSHDGFAHLWDMQTYEKLRSYDTGIPLNTGDVLLDSEHILVGGGQEASQVTTSATSVDKLASGSEDGMVRLLHLNKAFFTLTKEKKRHPAKAAARKERKKAAKAAAAAAKVSASSETPAAAAPAPAEASA